MPMLPLDLVISDATARREWSWLVLPLRWGYPVAESPFAGIVAHAETGNLAVVGPAFNAGWNRAGASAGFALYSPNKFDWFVPLGWQDGFQNELGWANLTLPTFVMPPSRMSSSPSCARISLIIPSWSGASSLSSSWNAAL